LTTALRRRSSYLVSNPRLLHNSLPDFPRFAESGWGAEYLFSQTGFNPKGATVPEETPQSGLTDNSAAGLAYITFIPAIIFLVTPPYNQKSFIRFHSWQSIFLSIAWFAVWVVLMAIGMIPLVNLIDAILFPLVFVGFVIVWIILLINAFNGKRIKLPIIGDLAERQANR
jgi:uncharacterized membrane protein